MVGMIMITTMMIGATSNSVEEMSSGGATRNVETDTKAMRGSSSVVER
jgi:hypothetical protein